MRQILFFIPQKMVSVLFVFCFFIALLAFPFYSAHAQTVTIGETAILSANDSGNGNLLVAQQATLSGAATIQSLSFYVNSVGGDLRLGIYDATGPSGGPGAKIAETNSFTPIIGWNTASVITPVLIPAGTYWLAYLPSNNNVGFKLAFNGSAKWYSYTYGVMPGTFSTSPSGGSYHWSFYATLNTTPPTPDTTAPTTPQNFTVTTISSSQINLSWSTSTDPVISGETTSGIAYYEIFRDSISLATTTSTAFVNTGLTASTTYSYTVRAIDVAGNTSLQSTTTSATTQTISSPTVTLSASPTTVPQGGQTTLTWSTTDATSCTASDGWSGTKGLTGSEVITNLATTTTFILDCSGAGGSASQSAMVFVMIPDTTPPTTPTNLTATSTSSTQIDLTWTASTDDTGVSGYHIFRDSIEVATTGATNYADLGLLASTTYSYTVRAFDGAGNASTQSASASAVTQAIIPPSSITYDFENGTMPSAFDITPNSPWTIVTSQKHSGTYAIKSGNAGVNNSFSQLTLLADFQAGDISFWRRYESEGNYDKFIFLIDGVVQTNYPKSGSGTTWTQDTFTATIPAGVHSLDWIYAKDSSVNSGGDGVWLDDIIVPNFTPVSDKGESFESGIPATWTNDATKVWLTTNVNYRKKLGSYSARSYTPLGNNGVSTLQKTITTSGGDMWFYYYISSEVGDDLLKFYIDGVEQSNVAASGYYDSQRDPLDAGWIFRKYTIPAGTHTFKWEYSKDKGGVSGNDAAFIDLAHFPTE